MIRVNLLPEEFRRTGGQQPLMLGVLLGGVVPLAILGCVYVYLWFNAIVAEEKLALLQQEVSQLNAQAAEVDSLQELSLIHISEPTRLLSISYAVFCLKKKKQN